MREDEAPARRMPLGRPPARGQVAAIAAAVVALVGSGAGGGYYLHGGDGRDEHAQFAAALQDCTTTNRALRDAVVMLTERLGATRDEVKGVREDVRGLDARLRAVEATTRSAGYRTP